MHNFFLSRCLDCLTDNMLFFLVVLTLCCPDCKVTLVAVTKLMGHFLSQVQTEPHGVYGHLVYSCFPFRYLSLICFDHVNNRRVCSFFIYTMIILIGVIKWAAMKSTLIGSQRLDNDLSSKVKLYAASVMLINIYIYMVNPREDRRSRSFNLKKIFSLLFPHHLLTRSHHILCHRSLVPPPWPSLAGAYVLTIESL